MLLDKTRLSTCSIALNDRSAERAFEVIAAAGFEKVDVHEKVHFSIFSDECDIVALKEAAASHNLKIANLASYAGGGLDGRRVAYSYHDWQVANPERFTSCGFSSTDPEEREAEFEQMMQTIDHADLLGSRSVRVVPGDDQPSSIDTLVPWFKRASAYAGDKGIYLAVENHGGGIAGTPELCVRLAQEVDSPYFGILYEPGNLMHDTGTDYRAALERMKNYLVHVHLKDCKPVAGGYQMQHFGEGTIDFAWIMRRLEEVGYKGDFALEYELHEETAEVGLPKFYRDFTALFESV
jgi:sugar phosphate isomerase/epimerase